MKNELQVVLNSILNDKNTNLKPENLKAGITCLGVDGTLQTSTSINGIKLFSTVEEMNQSIDNQEGDLAVVYKDETKNMTAKTETQYITFPEKVTLSEPFTDSIFGTLVSVDDSVMFDGTIQLSEMEFRLDCYTNTGTIRIAYTSSDGTVYNREEFSNSSNDLTNPVDFGTVIKYEAMFGEWNDALGYFMQIGANVFDGLYECKLSETSDYEIKQINLDGTITKINDSISMNVVNEGIVKSYIAFGNPINYYPKVYIDTNRKNLIIYSSGSSSLYISTNSSYQNKILDSYSSNVSTDVFTKYCIFNIENKTTELKDLDIIGVATVNDDNIVNIPYQFFIGGFSCYDSSSGNVTVDNNVYSIKPNNFDIYKTDTSFNPTSSVVITENVGNPIVHSQLQYSLCATQLDSVANCVYKSIFYGKNGVEIGTLTQNVSNQFNDISAEVYTKMLVEYNKFEPVVLTDSNKTISKDIQAIPIKLDGTPLIDTSAITNMKDMFISHTNLIAIPNINTSNVTTMYTAFMGCTNLATISNIDTSKVTDMYRAFDNCTNLVTIPTLNLSSVTRMAGTFNNCVNLKTIPNLDTKNVTEMTDIFLNCYNLTSIAGLNTSNLTKMTNMFTNCTNLITLPDLNTINVTSMLSTFTNCISISEIPDLNTTNVTNMYYTFYNCRSLTNIPNIITNNVTNFFSTFGNCINLTNIPTLNLNSAKVVDYMFSNCANIVDIPMLDFSHITNMFNTFLNCENLSEESLNNILAMCASSIVANTSRKNLKSIGLTENQANICMNLSNYSVFTSAGWTKGY